MNISHESLFRERQFHMQGKWQELSLFKYIFAQWAPQHNRPQYLTLQSLTPLPTCAPRQPDVSMKILTYNPVSLKFLKTTVFIELKHKKCHQYQDEK